MMININNSKKKKIRYKILTAKFSQKIPYLSQKTVVYETAT